MNAAIVTVEPEKDGQESSVAACIWPTIVDPVDPILLIRIIRVIIYRDAATRRGTGKVFEALGTDGEIRRIRCININPCRG